MDYNIDSAGKHTVMVAGTLNGQSVAGNGAATPRDCRNSPDRQRRRRVWTTPAGSPPATHGSSSPHLVNALNYGYNRFSEAGTGNTTSYPTFDSLRCKRRSRLQDPAASAQHQRRSYLDQGPSHRSIRACHFGSPSSPACPITSGKLQLSAAYAIGAGQRYRQCRDIVHSTEHRSRRDVGEFHLCHKCLRCDFGMLNNWGGHFPLSGQRSDHPLRTTVRHGLSSKTNTKATRRTPSR